MKAVIIKEHGKATVAETKDQTIRPSYIKVKTVALAINPTDFHHTASAGPVGGILGCDLSGVAEEVGPECKSDVKKGDAVYGVCHGANNDDLKSGAFAEYALVKDGHLAKMPEGLGFEEAATLGVGITTSGQALYMTLGLPLPSEPAKKPFPVLIYGGSSASGTLAIQFAKLSGLTVVTTASPKNFDLVKSRGADAVFDYHDPDCGKKIRDFTNNSLQYAMDTISTAASYGIIAEAFPEPSQNVEEKKLVSLLPLDGWERKDVNASSILCYTTFGEPFAKFGMDFPAIPTHYDYGVMFWKLAHELLEQGKLKPHPTDVRLGGLQGVVAGIQEMAGGVSAVKLVYRVDQTAHVIGQGEAAVSEHITAPELRNW